MLKIIINLFCLFVCIQSLNLCGDWTQYKDKKCFKVLSKKTTQSEALEKCVELNEHSSLVTIYDQEEQQFINELLAQFNHISMNAWIGMEYNGHEYDWLDGTDSNFTNWSEDAVKEGSEPCVKMSLLNRTLGKWTDSSCKRQALIICQKRPILNLNTLKDFIEIMTETNDKQRLDFEVQTKELENKINFLREDIESQQKVTNDLKLENENLRKESDSLIPLGFIYTQLPEQLSPVILWPNLHWEDVTTQYAGLFFRAEGSGSETFGQVQQANQSLISEIRTGGYRPPNFNNYAVRLSDYPDIKPGQWKKLFIDQAFFDRIELFTTEGEVRPKNTAIKIWKRIDPYVKIEENLTFDD